MRIWPSFVVALAVMTTPAMALDCGKATTKVETAICASAELQALDAALVRAFGEVKALSSKPEQKMLVLAQRKWLADRENSCPASGLGIDACIKSMTETRIKHFDGTPDSGPGNGSRIVPFFLAQTGSETVYEINADLYRFADAKSQGEKRFNAYTRKIAAMLKLGPHGMESEGRIYARDEFMTLSYVSPKFLSVMHSYWYDEGGAHGNGGIENLNIDMETGKELGIESFFSEDAAAKLAQQCREQIVAEKKERIPDEPYDPATDDTLKDEVIAEHIATLSRWSFKESEASVSFDAYAIGSYAEGSYDCTFTMTDLKVLALPGAPLP